MAKLQWFHAICSKSFLVCYELLCTSKANMNMFCTKFAVVLAPVVLLLVIVDGTGKDKVHYLDPNEYLSNPFCYLECCL